MTSRTTAIAAAIATLALASSAALSADAHPGSSRPKGQQSATHTSRHSGTIVALDPAHDTLTLQEMVPVRAGHNALVKRTIALDRSTTRVEMEHRTGNGRFEASPMALAHLVPGQYVTVVTRKAGRKLAAVEVDVVKPGDTGAAASRS